MAIPTDDERRRQIEGGVMASTWAIEFDYRSDDGPTRVGPFDTKEDAELYLLTLQGFDFEAGYVELVRP